MFFLLVSEEKGERWSRQFSVVCGFDLRLWLWSVDILKYFLGTPSQLSGKRFKVFRAYCLLDTLLDTLSDLLHIPIVQMKKLRLSEVR